MDLLELRQAVDEVRDHPVDSNIPWFVNRAVIEGILATDVAALAMALRAGINWDDVETIVTFAFEKATGMSKEELDALESRVTANWD